MNYYNIVKSLLKMIIFLFIVYFFSDSVFDIFSKINFADVQFNLVYLFLSFIFILLGFVSFGINWTLILNFFSAIKLSKVDGIIIWVKSQFYKYIPGIVMVPLGRLYLCSGFKKKDVVYSVFFEFSYLVTSAILLGLLFLYFNYISVMFVVFCFLIIFMLKYISFWKFDKFKKVIQVRLFSLYFLSWLSFGIGFFMLSKSLFDVSIVNLLFFIGVFAISWSAGFLAFIFPGGIGVRETVIVLLLSSLLTSPTALLVALFARLWWVIGELLSLSFVLFRSSTRAATKKS